MNETEGMLGNLATYNRRSIARPCAAAYQRSSLSCVPELAQEFGLSFGSQK